MFGAGRVWIKTEPRHFMFRYRSAQHLLDVFRTFYGPMLKAFAALDIGSRTRWRTTCSLSSGA